MTARIFDLTSGHTIHLKPAGEGALLHIDARAADGRLDLLLNPQETVHLQALLDDLIGDTGTTTILPGESPSGLALYAHIATVGEATLTIAQARDPHLLWLTQTNPNPRLLLSGQQLRQLRDALANHLARTATLTAA
jgi:hypothetical protein